MEYAPFQKVPKRKIKKTDMKKGTIEIDPDYTHFLKSLEEPDILTVPPPETLLEEIEAREKELKANHGVLKVTTPLLEYLKRKKEERRAALIRAKEDRKRRDAERRRQREEERRRRKEREFREREQREKERQRQWEKNRGRKNARFEDDQEDDDDDDIDIKENRNDKALPIKLLKNPDREKERAQREKDDVSEAVKQDFKRKTDKIGVKNVKEKDKTVWAGRQGFRDREKYKDRQDDDKYGDDHHKEDKLRADGYKEKNDQLDDNVTEHERTGKLIYKDSRRRENDRYSTKCDHEVENLKGKTNDKPGRFSRDSPREKERMGMREREREREKKERERKVALRQDKEKTERKIGDKNKASKEIPATMTDCEYIEENMRSKEGNAIALIDKTIEHVVGNCTKNTQSALTSKDTSEGTIILPSEEKNFSSHHEILSGTQENSSISHQVKDSKCSGGDDLSSSDGGNGNGKDSITDNRVGRNSAKPNLQRLRRPERAIYNPAQRAAQRRKEMEARAAKVDEKGDCNSNDDD